MHVMIDLETWGTEPGCDLRSIGACVFDPYTGQVCRPVRSLYGEGYDDTSGVFYVATDNPRDHYNGSIVTPYGPKYPLHRSPDTVEWWNKQSPEAQTAFDNPVDLREALHRFGLWYYTLEPSDPPRIWCKGPHFDIAILAAAYRAVGLTVPWHYRSPRDMRTVVDLAGITYDEEKALFTGTPHHALDDAISQAMVICEAYKRLGKQK